MAGREIKNKKMHKALVYIFNAPLRYKAFSSWSANLPSSQLLHCSKALQHPLKF